MAQVAASGGARAGDLDAESDPKRYLREEVQAEALTRNLDAFSRFLVAASFSQAAVLSVSTVARDLGLGYSLFYWRTRDQTEVDFVLYDERGLVAIEVKRSPVFRERDLAALRVFASDYPVARCVLLYGGEREYVVDGIRVLPLASALPDLLAIIR
jgi:predicted AAA+ superfamily ATPase